MTPLADLSDKAAEEWDRVITEELSSAGIDIHKFREYNTPHYSCKHTLEGMLGAWTFKRSETCYNFWGNVPLASAEVIAADQECLVGCIPMQWFPKREPATQPPSAHAFLCDHITWIAGEVQLEKDVGYSKRVKRAIADDSPRPIRFVVDPSDPKEDGKPFVFHYTFFTREALKNFVTIVRRHRLDFTHTY